MDPLSTEILYDHFLVMFQFNPNNLGSLLIILGISAFVLAYFLLRVVPKTRLRTQPDSNPPIPLELLNHSEAVLLVQAGGRIVYVNQAAQEWFNLWDEDPNIERLGRRTRPVEAFLGLCATEGQTRFSLDGRLIEGTSYSIPFDTDRAMLVSLRHPQLVVGVSTDPSTEDQARFTGRVSNILTELSQAMAASLDLETTMQTILESIDRLIPSDLPEITIWDADHQHLIPYRLIGLPGLDRRFEKSTDRYSPGEGYTGHLVTQRKPLSIPDVDAHRQIRPVIDREQYPFCSYLGVPMLVAGELVGTLELASLPKEAFTQNDLEVLRILSEQAAVAVRNASLYEEEQRRAQELAGLAQLTQVASALKDPQDLFTQLIESLKPLLDVEILGFLIYDEDQRTLEAQLPFFGLQPNVIEWYSAIIEPESPAEKVWLALETIVTTDAPSDPRLKALEFHHLAQAAGISHTVLVPLTSGGRPLGYLQVADKRDGSPFDRDDLRLLAIIAGQAAPIIENATLIQQSRQRVKRAETLRHIASLTASAASLDEILRLSIKELVKLLQSDIAAIFLLEEARGELRVHEDSIYGIPLETADRLSHISVDDPQYHLTVTNSRRPYVIGDAAEDPDALPVYRPLMNDLDLQSAIITPLIVRDRGIGEMILGSHKPAFFNPEDVRSVTTAAGQLAGAIEQATLYSQTDESLRVRVDQLTALTYISRELNSTLELEYLIQRVHDEALRTTRADCGTILLFEPGPTQSPKVILHLGDPPAADLHPLEQVVLDKGETFIVEDFEVLAEVIQTTEKSSSESPFTAAYLQPAHEGIRSALIVPIAYQEQVAGLIHLHAKEPNRFDEAAREISEALAIQAAIALGNAQRYQEQVRRGELLNRRVGTLAKIFETTQSMQLEQPLEQALEDIAYAIQGASPFNIVLVSVYDQDSDSMQFLTGTGISLAAMEDLQTHPQSWSDLQEILKPEFRTGRAFFIPSGDMPLAPTDIPAVMALPTNGDSAEAEPWHSEDTLVIPLLNTSGQPLGMISVDAPRDNLRPDRPTIETLEIFASHATLVIESQKKLLELNTQVSNIQNDLDRTQKIAQTAQSHLPTLLHKDLEQTIAIRRLSQRARRISAGMDITETVNRQVNRSDVLLALGREFLTRMGLDVVLIAELSSGGPHLLHSLGTIPEGVNTEALLGQRNPLHQSLQTGEIILVSQLDDNPEWTTAPLLHALETKSFFCLPIRTENGLDSAALAISQAPVAPFSLEDEQLYTLMARQVSIRLQNLNLLTETSRRLEEVNLLLDFSRRLGSLEPTSILTTLVDSVLTVLPAAQAAMVALWDPKRNILVPQAASGYSDNQRIMEIEYQTGEALPGQVFEQRKLLRLDEVDFAKHYNISSENLLRYRDATGGRLPVSSMVAPIEITSHARPFGVLVLDNFTTPATFTEEAQILIASLTHQTALNLENTRLYRASEQRASQLEALTRVAATITSSLQPDTLITTLLEQLDAFLPYETGTLWLRQEDEMIVRAARGFADSDERVGLSVAIEDSQLLKSMISTSLPISVGDVRQDARFPALVEHRQLSWLGVPLIASGEVIGVIALEKTEPEFYTPEHVQMATTFAGQAAVALENANLYQESVGRTLELDQRSRRLTMLNRLSNELSESLDTSHILEFTMNELLRALKCSGVSVVLFEASGRAILQAESPQATPDIPQPLANIPLFDRLRETLGVFIMDDVSAKSELTPLIGHLNAHNTHTLLAFSLATGNDLHGILLVHADQPYRLTTDEMGLARTISNQAAIAIQNAQLYAETRSLTEDLEQRVNERTTQLAREHQRTEILLRIITELSVSLDLEKVLNRTLRVLNEIVDAEQISVLLLRPGENELHHLASIGQAPSFPSEGAITYDPDQSLAGWVIKQGQPTLIADVQEEHWGQFFDISPNHRCAIAVPLMVGAEVLGALLFFHHQTNHFSLDQLDLIQAAANQVAIAVNNAELYRLIRDQAEDLGKMFRSQQIETSRSQAILEAVADGVLVTDSGMNITLFNASAEQILGLDRSKVIGKSLGHFTGLFGQAAQTWMETIRGWSQGPITFQSGEIYAERITLEDDRVVSVHLAPVSMQAEPGSTSDFLGTVSIFRDITHQVEVDRLKSEFVATVSHELRTPMTSIKGYVDVLLMGAAGPMSEQQTNFLDIVRSNTDRLTVLVNDLLDVSRIEAGQASLSLQPLDLNEVTDEMIAYLKRRSEDENKPMLIEVNRSPGLPLVTGDRERVNQILENLLDNAYAYTPENGRITLYLEQVGDEIQIDVQDTGVGIPPELQNRVFERFYRGEHPFVLATSGTGLGLSIVQYLVEMHQGRIWVESSGIPGEGCKFSFTLSVYNPEKT